LPPWSRPLEVERLADGGADIEFAVPLAELSGLRSLRAGVAGNVHGRARFSREQDMVVAELALHGSATLECQRCMRPMELPIDTLTRIALVASEGEAARVPSDLEPVLVAGGRISAGELVTEELLLTLPIVPLHGHGAVCASASAGAALPQNGGETHKPFARLGELLKRQV
jgi:uncharacterized protein